MTPNLASLANRSKFINAQSIASLPCVSGISWEPESSDLRLTH